MLKRAIVGLYGLVAHAASRRTREIGVALVAPVVFVGTLLAT